MKLLTFVQFLHIAAVTYAAVILPHKRFAPSGNTLYASNVTVISTQVETTTDTQVTTVTGPPGTLTVVLQDPNAITSSLSSAISVESEQLEIVSQVAPNNPLTSGRPPTATPATVFTRTITVPIFGATNSAVIPGQISTADVYFISENNGTTSWLTNFTPEESMTVGTTTVTLSPVASTSSVQSSFTRSTGSAFLTSTFTTTRSQLSSASLAISEEVSDSKYRGGTSSTARSAYSGSQTLNASPSYQVVTVRRSSTVATITIPRSATTSIALPTGADGSIVDIEFPTAEYYKHKRSADGYRKRAVCEEWVTATLGGSVVSWPNNWDGSKTVDCATVSASTTESPTTAPSTTSIAVEPTPTDSDTGLTPMSASAAATGTASSSSTASAVSTDTASCDVASDFTLDFDTLPVFFPPDNDTAPFPPIFNPYRNLYFSSGWAYVPPPTIPVSPHEGSHLAVYVPSDSASQPSNTGLVPDGAFGAGPRASESAYRFDAKSLYVFCDNGAADTSTTCDVAITGYRWEEATQSEWAVVTQHFPQPPCPGYRNCQTNIIYLNDEFRGLSSVSLYGRVNGDQKMVFMDTVQLTWSDDSCEAGLLRTSQV